MGLVTLLAPVLALWLGWWIEGEVLSQAAMFGTLLVLGGLAWAQWGPMLVKWGREQHG